jgi:hypothetical protein
MEKASPTVDVILDGLVTFAYSQDLPYEINVLDMLMRHCLKEHTRETIAFGRRRNDSMYRMAIFLVWRNDIELRRKKRCRGRRVETRALKANRRHELKSAM